MKTYIRSLATATLVAAIVYTGSLFLLAPKLPFTTGRPYVCESQSLSLPAAPKVILTNQDGAILIRTHKTPKILIETDIRVYTSYRSEFDQARAFMKDLIATQTAPAAVEIVTDSSKRPDNFEITCNYEIAVPTGTSIEIHATNGNVWVSKGCGAVAIYGSNTDIEVVEPQGPVEAKSTNGRIRVVDAPQGAKIETINGNLYAHMDGGPLTASTVNGAIVAHRRTAACQDFTLETHNGGITVIAYNGTNGCIDASTDRGTLRCTAPVTTAPGETGRRHLRGTLGVEDGIIKIHTINGNIWIDWRES